jgi:hypothetical protein
MVGGRYQMFAKCTPKKNCNRKKSRRCPIGNLIPYRAPSVVFFLITVFFSGCTFTGKLLLEKSIKTAVHVRSCLTRAHAHDTAVYY